MGEGEESVQEGLASLLVLNELGEVGAEEVDALEGVLSLLALGEESLQVVESIERSISGVVDGDAFDLAMGREGGVIRSCSVPWPS